MAHTTIEQFATELKLPPGALIEQLANAPDQQHLVVLVVAPVAPTLHRLELGELLLPIAQHVRLDAAQLAHLTDGEVAFGRDGGERFLH